MNKNAWNTRVSRNLKLRLTVDGNYGIQVDERDTESGEDYRLVFDGNTETKNEIIKRIGEEIYSWISLMIDEVQDEMEALETA